MRDKVQRTSIFFLSRASDFRENVWAPEVDVYRRAGGCLVKCALAGVRPEDVAVSLEGSKLTICGIRRDPMVEEGWEHDSMEIPYGRFERSLTLPDGLQGARITAHYRDGMLLVRVREESR
ncbi:MAG: Hsp20/alpha crystallin family protein [Acidobacteriia bacterium]|nr:Hsp20/alpha crystallin family protein [Terriglobia bacterium]